VLQIAGGNESLGVRTVLDNLSAKDFCLQLNHPVKQGENLLVITQLSQAILILRGEVTRVEEEAADTYRLCVSITQHKIFSSLAGDHSVEKLTIKDSRIENSRLSEIPLG
jgi:SpoU rRNA methylase family enzyme